MTPMRLALMMLFTACTTDTTDTTPDSDSQVDTDAAFVAPTLCEFEDIAGTWGRTEAIPQFPGFTEELEIASGEEGESIGTNRIYDDSGSLCTFDITCGLSEVPEHYYVYITLLGSNPQCVAGSFHLRLDGGQLEAIFNPLDSPGSLGNETYVFERDF